MWIRSFLIAAVAACSSSSSSPATTTASPAPSTGSAVETGSGTGSAKPAAGPGIGETCGPSDACGEGLACISYYGIAGAKGPQFKTCEQRCEDDTTCPKDRHCATIADGPGRVCR